MGILKTRRFKKAVCILLIVLLAGSVSFALRGPYMSNFLKRVIMRQVEAATGHQVIAQKVYVNMFPLFIGARDIKAFDEKGQRVFTIDAVKSYIGLSGILKGEIEVERLFLDKPKIWAERSAADKISENIKRHTTKKRKFLRVNIKTVEIKDAEISFYDEERNLAASGKGIDINIKLNENPEVSFSAGELATAHKDWPEIKGRIEGLAMIKPDGIDLKRLKLSSNGSYLEGMGIYSKSNGRGNFNTSLELLMSSIKKIFGLKQTGKGRIQASGTIKILDDIYDPFIDLNVKGDFYLETLMEVLKVKKEPRLNGLINFRGRVNGFLSDIKGSASARLQNGNLFGVSIEDLKCRVSYSNGLLSFKNGKGRLYHGEGEAEASITLPRVKHYTLNINVRGVDSKPLIDLVKLSELNIPQGKADMSLYTTGIDFNPKGQFSYTAKEILNHPMGRLGHAKGSFEKNGSVISIFGINLKTEMSDLLLEGSLDTALRTINMKGSIKTAGIEDLTSPYFGRLHGEAEAEAVVTGTFEEPFIEARLTARRAQFDDYIIGNAEARMSYKKDILEIVQLTAEAERTRHSIKGNIRFPFARKVLDIKEPDYDLTINFRNADFEGLLRTLNIKIPLKGRLDSEVSIKGTEPVVSGPVLVSGADIYGVPIQLMSFSFSYDSRDLKVPDGVLKKGGSMLYLKGSASRQGGFSFSASSNRLYLKDFLPKGIPINYTLSLEAEGKGTFDDPDIKLIGKLEAGKIRGRPQGGGIISALLKGRNLSLSAKLFNEMLALNAMASLEGDMPWSAELDMGQGRYDFLLGVFLSAVPEDTVIRLNGAASLRGTRRHIEADATLTDMNVAVFGQRFSNDSDIKFSISDKKVFLKEVSLRSGYSSLKLRGGIEVGASYDLNVDGKASLSLLKGFSRKIDVIKGDAGFAFSLKGQWERPLINGSFEITGGSFALKGIPQHLTSINGSLHAEGNRIIIERLGAGFGGGDITASGIVYVDGFQIERLSLDAVLSNVTASITKDFTVNFGGNLVLRGTPETQHLSGDLRINRASYKQRIEWKSWLMEAKKMEAPKAEAWMDRIRLNIKVEGDNNITVDNNIARADLKIDTVVRGTAGHPLLFGRVDAKNGKVYFRNNEFRILSATADYTDPIKPSPFFGIVAETFSRGYHVWLSLQGKVDRFNLTLHSDPPLAETEILALLTVGEFGENLRGLEGGIGAAEAASFLTGKYQDVLEERFRDITGIDRLQIDPYVSKTTDAVVPRISVSKKLVGERLFVTYSTAVGAAEEQVLKLEYALAANVSLVGIRDERGSVGGDIKFRFQFK